MVQSNGNGGKKEEPTTTSGKVLSAVAKATSPLRRFLVARGIVKNEGQVADGYGGVIILDSPLLSAEQILDLDNDKPVKLSSNDKPVLPDRMILLPAAPPASKKKSVDPDTRVNAKPIARGLIRMGMSRSIVQDAVGGALSPKEVSVESLKAQSGQGEDSLPFGYVISARNLTNEGLNDLYAETDISDEDGVYSVVEAEEFEEMLVGISPDYEGDQPGQPEGPEKKDPEKTGGTTEEGAGHGHV